jgi:hypothetical protein
MNKKCFFSLAALCLSFCTTALWAQTNTAFAMRQVGYYMGGAKYKVKSTGDAGSYPIGYLTFEGIYFTEDNYYMGNASYFLNGGNAWKEGKDGISGVDISFIEAAVGSMHGKLGTGMTVNYGWHGPWLPNNVTGAYEDKGNFLGVGLQLAHVQPFAKVFRAMTVLTSEALLTNSGQKIFDGYSIRFDSQFQFVPFRWLAFGVRPGFEYRSYRLDNTEKKDIRTWTSTVQFCIGINFWKHAQSY